ncbi:cysteine desulfurase family protein [Jiella mangrovi]|uniref:Cysteine desulfurase n=1 Tax=Jiella mangrovi TaxID=2821407 RepID=A0ABS4BK53_9HYPH|nr:cysteine desulfurase family protein [Jiella mangrovi]MBP0617086.1 cysteine desulfurase [Jiella mangrovi]
MNDRDERLYLDHNASAPLIPEARDAAIAALALANPSSTHREGRAARAVCEDARRSLARLVGGKAETIASENLVFTSGATEAANQLLSPRWLIDGEPADIRHLAVIETDHPATREGGHFDPAAVTRLPVDRDGVVDLGALAEWTALASESGPAMLAFSWANSETGVIQPLAAIRGIIEDKPIRLVLDAAQIGGRLPIDLAASGADAIILSGHKLGSLKGAGAIALKTLSTRPFALHRGGGQERGMRPGTEALPAIASFGAAAKVAIERGAMSAQGFQSKRALLEDEIAAALPDAVILGKDAERLPNTVAIMHPDIKAETAQIALDLAGIAVSAGSACTSGKVGPSHVVAAMAKAGLAIDPGLGAIRVSFGAETDETALRRFVSQYARLARRASARAA